MENLPHRTTVCLNHPGRPSEDEELELCDECLVEHYRNNKYADKSVDDRTTQSDSKQRQE